MLKYSQNSNKITYWRGVFHILEPEDHNMLKQLLVHPC